MSHQLPDHLDPWRSADLGRRVAGVYRLQDLPRLAASLMDSAGEGGFTLEFVRDPQQRACLRGRVRCELLLQCQRCLQVMQLPVDSQVALAFVADLDAAAQLPREWDPHLVEGDRIRLRDLIEEELLLCLPQVAMHPLDDCPAGTTSIQSGRAEAAARNNPFAVLAELYRDPK